MGFPILESLLEYSNSTKATKDYDGTTICESRINGALVGIGSYDMLIQPEFHGGHEELIGYQVKVDSFSVLISPGNDKNVKYEVTFTADSFGHDIQQAFSQMVDKDGVYYYVYTNEDNFAQPEDAPPNTEPKLLDIAKNYVLNNDCYSDQIAGSYLHIMQ